MVLWYIYTLTHINTLKRAYKHVTRVYINTLHIQCDTFTGILYTLTGHTHTHLTGGHADRTHNEKRTGTH